MMFLNKFSTLIGLFIISIVVATASAQVSTGFPPFSSFQREQFDSVNLANLNVHFEIPIIHKAGRGIPFDYLLGYDSLIWLNDSDQHAWVPVSTWGWRGISEAITGYASYKTGQTKCFQGQQWWYGHTFSAWTYHDPTGTPRSFAGFTTDCGDRDQLIATSNDGLFTLDVESGNAPTVYTTSGTRINPPTNSPTGAGSVTDRNGNVVSTTGSSFTDTSGAIALTVSGTNPQNYTYTGPSGNTSIVVNYRSYTIRTNFGCSGTAEYPATPQSLVDTIQLPDGSQYSFTYETTPGYSPDVTGRIASVTLRSGGQVVYSYTGSNNGVMCADGSTAGLNRTTPDGTWTYTRSGTPTSSTTTILDTIQPTPNKTVVTFSNGYETSRKLYQGASTILKTVYTCYNNNSNIASCPNATVSLPIMQQSIYYWLGDYLMNQSSEVSYTYNTLGLTTDKYEYNFGSVGAYPLLRHTNIQYAPLSNYIADQPAQITTYDGSGTIVAQTTSSNFDSYGNAQTVTSWVSPTQTLTRTFTYLAGGGVNVATDVNGAQSTYTYGRCNNTLLTNISLPVNGLSINEDWDCDGGVITAYYVGDVSMGYGYQDPLWRVTGFSPNVEDSFAVQYNNVNDVEASMTFQDDNNNSVIVDRRTTVDTSGRVHVQQRRQSPTSLYYDSVETDYDPLGRVSRITLPYQATAEQTNPSAPAKFIVYDALGRTTQVSDSGGGLITYSYPANSSAVDVLVTVTGDTSKIRQFEYDALGRLTSVCEVSTTLPGVGTCGQAVARTGYWTKYTYNANGRLTSVTQNAQLAQQSRQIRTFSYDGTGRMTSETNPESGITTYYYDSQTLGICTPSNGDLVARQDNAGNITCYTYDALHRVTSAGNPTVNGSTYRYFVYDFAYLDDTTMFQTVGRLAEAYTVTVPNWQTKVTDEGFGYDFAGRQRDLYELTPHSGGYYKVQQYHWPSGIPNNISIFGTDDWEVTWIVYEPDSEGRIAKTTNPPSGQNPVNSVSYNVAGFPTLINFGSGDSDSYAYDPNTNRMSQYSFNVNGTTVTGNLTWNPDGTLKILGITDHFNSANTQTCNFGFDGLSRIATANCGSAWSQTFTYDAYGNVTKSGSIAWQPGYDNNNHYTYPGTSYDPDGNVLNDTFHTYTYDANWGTVLSVGDVNVTYDALGRMVEQNRSGNYTEVLYTPEGRSVALMYGNTLDKAFFPLPGGGDAVYTSAGLAYYRHADWLGSSRLASTPSRTMSTDQAYAPFGENYVQTGSKDLDFTGQNATITDGLYDFVFREYHAKQGRWLSPDPVGGSAADPSNPQSWNRYAYVVNNPTSLIDPLGMMCSWNVTPFTVAFTTGEGTLIPVNTYQISWDCKNFDDGRTGGGSGGRGPSTKPKSTTKTPNCLIQRVRLVAQAFINYELAAAKFSEAALAGVAAAETDGFTFPGVIYGVLGGAGNLTAAGAQLAGAATGQIKVADEAATTATTLTTIGGIYGIIKTQGDIEAASTYAGAESLFASGVRGGLSGRLFEGGIQGLLDLTELGQNVADVLGLNGTCDAE